MAGAKESRAKRRADRNCLQKINFTPDLLAKLLVEKRRGGGKHRLKLGKSVEHEEFVIELLEKKGLPLTQCELAKLFEKRFKFSVHRTTVSKFLKRIGMRRKVIQKQLSRQSLTEKNLSLRRQFVQRWFAAGSFDMDKIGTVEEFADQRRWRLRPVCDGGVVDSPAQVFFIDETGCNRHTLERKHGYARAGKACRPAAGTFDSSKGINHSVIIALSHNSVLAHRTLVGDTKSRNKRQRGTKRIDFCRFLKEKVGPGMLSGGWFARQ